MASHLRTLSDLQLQYDGPIPESERDALRHGSHLASLIASEQANVNFYRNMIVRNRLSAHEWFRRGNIVMAENNRRDGWIYLTGWRNARKALEQFKRERRVAEGTLKTLSGIDGLIQSIR
jgi:hypothetical protein